MQFDPDQIGPSAVYKILTGSVIPRPIGWISSISKEGIPNLAPFSFFNAVGEDPPHVMFSTVHPNNTNKDTLNNILETGEFVVNLVTEANVELMNGTSAPYPPDVNEFEAVAGLTALPSVLVKPSRVAESPIHFECRLVHHYSLEGHQNGGATVIIGRIVLFHVNEDIISADFKIDAEKYRPVARLAGSNYAALGKIFSLKRPLP